MAFDFSTLGPLLSDLGAGISNPAAFAQEQQQKAALAKIGGILNSPGTDQEKMAALFALGNPTAAKLAGDFVMTPDRQMQQSRLGIAQEELAMKREDAPIDRAYKQAQTGKSLADIAKAKREQAILERLGDPNLSIEDKKNLAMQLDPATLRQVLAGEGVGASRGGAIENAAAQIMAENPGMSFTDAYLLAKSGVGVGGTINPDGTVTNRPGFAGAQSEVAGAKASGKMKAENLVEAQKNLPKIEDQAEYMLGLLSDLKSHPGLKYAVGTSSLLPIVPGTPAADFRTRLNQIKGQQFLQAYETLKGGGHITEIEGQKATEAQARMDVAQTEEEFTKALTEYQGIIRKGLERARKSAGSNTSASQTASGNSRVSSTGVRFTIERD